MSHLVHRHSTWSQLAAIATVAIISTGCGGSSEGSKGSTPTTSATSTTVASDEQRPEGLWTFVHTTSARNDAADFDPGLSRVRLAQLTPTCGSGPCDLDVTPAGSGGTYLPEGVASIDEPPIEPTTYSWNDADKTYTRVDENKQSSCTNVDGKVIQDAYSSKTSTTLAYRPAEGDRPPTLTGTYTTKVEATETGLANKCTPFEETGTAVGIPTGSLVGDAAPDLAGTYVTTETVTEVLPSGQRPPGFSGLLGQFELEASGEGYTAKGLIGEAALALDGTSYSGKTGEIERPCQTTPETPKAYTSTEEFTELAPIALTADGDPILAGGWSTRDEPTTVGVDASCVLSSNKGYVVLVPAASLG